jgi:lysophospholipase L1-like esterase
MANGVPTIALDLVPSGVMPVVYANQYDVGISRNFLLYNAGDVWNIPTGWSISCRGTKPDGLGVVAPVEFEGGVQSNLVTLKITAQMTAVAGDGIYELRLVQSSTHAVGTINFVLHVEEAALNDDTVISDSDVSYVETVLDQIQDVQAVANNVAQNAAAIAAETTARETADAQLQSNINAEATAREAEDTAIRTDLGEQIAALQGAVGSPLVAATKAAMTDTSKIYVYTGSESGMTAGDWYYYNGSAWVSGGVYNATAIQTDTTLSVAGMAADAAAAGTAIGNVANDLRKAFYLHPYGIEPAQMSLFKATANLFNNFCYHITRAYYRHRISTTPAMQPRITATTSWQGWLIRVKPNTTYTLGPLDFQLELLELDFTGYITISDISSDGPNTITTGPRSWWLCLTERSTRDMSEWMMVEGDTYPTEYISGHPQWVSMPTEADDSMRHLSFIYSVGRIEVKYYSDRFEVVFRNNCKVLTPKGIVNVADGTTLTGTASNYIIYDATEGTYKLNSGVANAHEYYYLGFVVFDAGSPPLAVIYGNYTQVMAKTIAFMGDSITAGVATSKCYHEFIYDEYRYTCLNYGYGGAGYYRSYPGYGAGLMGTGNEGRGVAITEDNYFVPNNVVARLAELDPNNTDGIVIFAGTNDFGNNVNIEDFRSGVVQAFEYCLTNFPGAPVLAMLPVHRRYDTTPNQQGKTLRDYCNVIVEECQKYGIAYIDTMTMSGLYPDNDANRTLYFADNLNSGLHPSIEGHRRIASVIARMLHDIVEFKNFRLR